MTQITLISVGNLKEGYLVSATAEYKKRLSAFAKVTEIELPEAPLRDESPAAADAALNIEADKILDKLPKDAYKIALCIEGDEPKSSEAFAALLSRGIDKCGKLAFVIGSSHGLSPRVKAACDERISFSRLTFPHQLMRVILTEAVYRSFTILAGKRYHK